MTTQTKHEIDFTRVNHDVNGNPRYAVHFTEFINEGDRILANLSKTDTFSIDTQYRIALNKARKIGGRKYHNKSYGGGIVFQSYNIQDTAKHIEEIKEVNTDFVSQFSDKEFRKVQRELYRHITTSKYTYIDDHSKPAKTLPYMGYEAYNNMFGFAYTSSGAYAALWLCNGVYLMVNDTHHVIGFTINANGEVIAISEDEKESPIYIAIENK